MADEKKEQQYDIFVVDLATQLNKMLGEFWA